MVIGFLYQDPYPMGGSDSDPEPRTESKGPKFLCKYCPAKLPNVKMLFDHYETCHAKTLRLYRVKYRPTKQVGLARAPSPTLACQRLGWEIRDCWNIEEVK